MFFSPSWLLQVRQDCWIRLTLYRKTLQIIQQIFEVQEAVQFAGLYILQGGAPLVPIFPNPPQAQQERVIVLWFAIQGNLRFESVKKLAECLYQDAGKK